MLVLGYIGDHRKDGLAARLGWGVVRLAQTGQRFGRVTHVEAVLGGSWRACTIASATVRDGSRVRTKTTELTPAHWWALDVPAWDVDQAAAWFAAHDGTPYSKLGAAASASPAAGLVIKGLGYEVAQMGQWCSRAVPQSVGVLGAEDLSPSEVFTLAWALPGTRDVTEAFFERTGDAAG